MTTSYTSLLGLALPVQGELSGTWGDTVNTSITSLVDSAVAGTTTLSTDADVTLSTTSGIANDARQAILLCSGARTVQRTITAPARSKMYVVINATSGGYAVKLVGVGPTTGVTVAAGKAAVLAWNGSDFVTVATTDASVLSGVLPVANGGTGVTTSTGSGNNVLSTSPTLVTPILGTPTSGTLTNTTGLPLTTGVTGTLPVANGGTGVTTSTGSGNTVLSTSPTLVTPILGTPTSGTLTNCTGLPLTTGVTGTLPVANGGTGITNNPNVIGIEFVIDGGGIAITTGVKGYLEVPFACTISQWTLLADTSGSTTVDVYSDTYANYGTNTSMVGAGTKPVISSATKAQSAPASWTTTSIAAGNIVGFNVTAATTVTRVTISLKVTRT